MMKLSPPDLQSIPGGAAGYFLNSVSKENCQSYEWRFYFLGEEFNSCYALLVYFHWWRAGLNSLLFFFLLNLTTGLSSCGEGALSSSFLHTNLIFFLQILLALKCLLEEVVLKTTLVLTFSTLQRKPTRFHSPPGAVPYLFGHRFNQLQVEC